MVYEISTEIVRDLERYYINADDLKEELKIKNSKIKVEFNADKVVVKYPVSSKFIEDKNLWEFCFIEIIIYRNLRYVKINSYDDLHIRLEETKINALWISEGGHIQFGENAFRVVGLGSNNSFYFIPSIVDDSAEFKSGSFGPYYINCCRPFIVEYEVIRDYARFRKMKSSQRNS